MNSPRRKSLCALVTVRWGEDVVAARHLVDGGAATIGADIEAIAPIPCEPLGLRAVIVAEVRGGEPVALVPRGAVGFRERPRALPSPVAGPSEITLAAGDTVSFSIGPFMVAVTAEEPANAAWAAPVPFADALSPARHVAVAALAHALLIGLAAQSAQASALEDAGPDHAELARYLAAADDRSRVAEDVQTGDGASNLGLDVNERDGNGKSGGGDRAKGPEGAMGAEASRTPGGGRYAVTRAPQQEYTPSTRQEALADARWFGLPSVLASDASRPFLPGFAEAAAAGPDAIDARGAMWATAIGETYGAGGLGLTGVGEGGGGTGEGVGLGQIGTLGHTSGRPGTGTGGGGMPSMGLFGMGGWWGDWRDGWGTPIGLGRIGTLGHGAGTGTAEWARRAVDRPEKVEDEGESRLPPHVIRRIVRANAGRFRLCYQAALLSNPRLAGGVTTRFLIGADGAVKSAQNLSADLPDKAVIACVTRSFYGLAFPAPPGGKQVTVTYPLTFSPDH